MPVIFHLIFWNSERLVGGTDDKKNSVRIYMLCHAKSWSDMLLYRDKYYVL